MTSAPDFHQAVALAQAGHKTQANAMLVQLLQTDPNNTAVLLWYAFTAADLGQSRAAIERVAILQPADPSLAQARSWLQQEEARQAASFVPPPAPQFAQAAYQPAYQAAPAQSYNSNSGYSNNNFTGNYSAPPRYFTQRPGYFERIGLGWQFMKQVFGLLREDSNLLKPAFYAIGLNLIVNLILGAALIGVYLATKRNETVLYICLFLVSVVSYFITYFFSSMTISLLHQRITTGASNMATAWAACKRKSGAILLVASISAFITTLRRFLRQNRRGIEGLIVGVILGIIDSIWTAYTYFVLPAIMIEDLQVGAAVKRATSIVKDNLLLIGVSYIGLGLVSSLLWLAFFMLSLMLAVGMFVLLANLNVILACVLALGFFVIGLAAVSAFTSYLRISYYTCLVIWARDVERQGVAARPPAPLRTVLEARAN